MPPGGTDDTHTVTGDGDGRLPSPPEGYPPGGADNTHTVTGDGDGRLPSPPEGYPPGPAAGPAGGGGAADQVVRYGPGVPALGSAGAAALTAEAVWRAGPPGAPRGRAGCGGSRAPR